MEALHTDKKFDPPSTLARQGLITVMLHMQGNPLAFDMSQWDGENECGTVYCIAGWATHLWEANPGLFHEDIRVPPEESPLTSHVARRVLDLDSSQADRLFFTVGWPEPFVTAYRELGTLLGEIVMPYRDEDGDKTPLPDETLRICAIIRRRMTAIALDRITNFCYGTHE